MRHIHSLVGEGEAASTHTDTQADRQTDIGECVCAYMCLWCVDPPTDSLCAFRFDEYVVCEVADKRIHARPHTLLNTHRHSFLSALADAFLTCPAIADRSTQWLLSAGAMDSWVTDPSIHPSHAVGRHTHGDGWDAHTRTLCVHSFTLLTLVSLLQEAVPRRQHVKTVGR